MSADSVTVGDNADLAGELELDAFNHDDVPVSRNHACRGEDGQSLMYEGRRAAFRCHIDARMEEIKSVTLRVGLPDQMLPYQGDQGPAPVSVDLVVDGEVAL